MMYLDESWHDREAQPTVKVLTVYEDTCYIRVKDLHSSKTLVPIVKKNGKFYADINCGHRMSKYPDNKILHKGNIKELTQ